VRQPQQRALIEDARIGALDKIGYRYAEIRDARIELNRQEKKLKARAIVLMHQHGKTTYKHEAIEIELEPGEEDIKVKVKSGTEIKSHGEANPDDGTELEQVENVDLRELEDPAHGTR
jgi:KaiC/GvpD/RAD55 family RecA-like ATPase